ncbi:MAG: YtxH domain-containing protein [Chloroflexi bacterium]|nr:YtxH domain-containing protein [Chloroflexota bacterium]
MKLSDIKGMRDLRDLDSSDVSDLIDELRGIAQKRGLEWLDRGKGEARRALGAPGPGSVSSAFVGGIVLGLIAGAVVAFLMTPMPGTEARRKLAQSVDRVREAVPDRKAASGNGAAHYERVIPNSGVTPAATAGGPTEL